MKKVLGGVAALLVSVIIVGTGTYQVINSRTFQFFGGLTHRVETSEKVVALTFDDGPTGKTPEILATLDRLDVKATFYVTGSELEKAPQYGRQIVDAGHELGNHSYSHQRMVFKDHAFVADEIERTDAAIRAAGYRGEITFRPPNGKKLLVLPYYLDKHDRKTITWDVEPDSDPAVAAEPAAILRNVTENTRPGSIILLHAMYERSASRDAVPGIVEALRRDGYRFSTVSELLRRPEYAVDRAPATDVRCVLGEGPIWSAAESALYWLDIAGKKVHRLIDDDVCARGTCRPSRAAWRCASRAVSS